MPSKDEEVTIPIHQEYLDVSRRKIISGRVTIRTKTDTHEEIIREMLESNEATVETHSINRIVDQVPEIRSKEDMLIIPVIEEVIVKMIMLKEEIVIKFIKNTRLHEETVMLRSQTAEIDTQKENQNGD